MIVQRGCGWQAWVFMNSKELIAPVSISPLFEIARVLVRFNHVARVIVSANHSAMRAAAKLRVVNDVADGVWLTIPQTTE
jgi:hypothetical protein